MANVLDVIFLVAFGAWAYLVAKKKRRDEVGWAIVAALGFFVPGYIMEQAIFPFLARQSGWPEAVQDMWRKPSAFIVGGLCALLVDLYLMLLVRPLPPPEEAKGGGPPASAGSGGPPEGEPGGEAPPAEKPPDAQEMAATQDYGALFARFWPVLAALAAFGLTYVPWLWLLARGASAGAAGAEPPDPMADVRFFLLPLVAGTCVWRLRDRPIEGLLAALFTLPFVPALQWMVWRWGRGSSYYSHGYLIPLVVLWLVWMNRRRLARLEASDDFRFAGLAVFFGGLLLLVAGAFIRAYFVQGFSLVVTLCGVAFFLYGRAISRILLFPLLFVIAMIPMPMHVVERLTFKLKMFAAWASVQLVDLLRATGLHDYVVVKDGSYIRWEKGRDVLDYIIVGDVCSGLRSLIALLAFGALFAYIAKLSMARKAALFAAAVPIAVLANMWRIVTLTFVACRWGSEATHGWVHDFTGYGIFAVAFVLFFSFERLLRGFGSPEPAAGG